MLAVILSVALVGAAVVAPSARGAHGVQYGLTDDAWLQDGRGQLRSRLATLSSLGVQIIRYTLNWNRIAPSQPTDPASPNDPAYDWSATDPVLNGLRTAGLCVVLQIVGTPSWANAGHGSNYAPTSAGSIQAFARAAALRYSWVKRWLIWNEPNQARWLRPTSAAVYTTRLLNPAYAAIHAAIPGAQVAGGVTAPRGSTGGVSPIAWIAGMRAAHARLDAYAHNPYASAGAEAPSYVPRGRTARRIQMGNLGILMALLTKYYGPKHLWITEYGYQTNPPDTTGFATTWENQALYMRQAVSIARSMPRVDMFIWFLLKDEPDIRGWQSGLETDTSRHKPSWSAFEDLPRG